MKRHEPMNPWLKEIFPDLQAGNKERWAELEIFAIDRLSEQAVSLFNVGASLARTLARTALVHVRCSISGYKQLTFQNLTNCMIDEWLTLRIPKIIDKDAGTWNVLEQVIGKMLRRKAARGLGHGLSSDLDQDLVQEVFMRVKKAISKWKPGRRLTRGYFFTVLNRLASAWGKKENRFLVVKYDLDNLPAGGPTMSRIPEIREAINRLPSPHREMLELFFFQQHSRLQAGRYLHLTSHETYKTYNEALKMLRRGLQGFASEP